MAGWTRAVAAANLSISSETIKDIEAPAGLRNTKRKTLEAVRDGFPAVGIAFIEDYSNGAAGVVMVEAGQFAANSKTAKPPDRRP